MAVSQFHMFYHYTVHIIHIFTICKTVFVVTIQEMNTY